MIIKEALTMPVTTQASLREPEDLFDPVFYGTDTGATQSLPRWCYTSRGFLEREIEEIFLR